MSRIDENKKLINETTEALELINKLKKMTDITPVELHGLLAPSNSLILSDISKSLAVIADALTPQNDDPVKKCIDEINDQHYSKCIDTIKRQIAAYEQMEKTRHLNDLEYGRKTAYKHCLEILEGEE